MQEIYKDSTDQEVYFDAVDVSGEFAVRLVGSSDGELMTGATVAVKEYKVATASISSPVISWVQALGKWKLVVPVANITQYGYGLIFITKAGIAPVTIEFKTVHNDAYFAGAGATPQEIWEYGSRTLTAAPADIANAIDELKGTGWTDETLKTLMDAIEAISITASIDAEDIVDAIFNTHLDSTTYETNDTNRSFGSIIWKLYRVRNYKV